MMKEGWMNRQLITFAIQVLPSTLYLKQIFFFFSCYTIRAMYETFCDFFCQLNCKKQKNKEKSITFRNV